MTENRTIPRAFKALITGYGIIGLDYAYIPATSVPEFSLKGDKPFTIFTTVCFKNTQNGSILEQQDMFQMGIMDGLLYVAAVIPGLNRRNLAPGLYIVQAGQTVRR